MADCCFFVLPSVIVPSWFFDFRVFSMLLLVVVVSRHCIRLYRYSVSHRYGCTRCQQPLWNSRFVAPCVGVPGTRTGRTRTGTGSNTGMVLGVPVHQYRYRYSTAVPDRNRYRHGPYPYSEYPLVPPRCRKERHTAYNPYGTPRSIPTTSSRTVPSFPGMNGTPCKIPTTTLYKWLS
jgi:hypothetical protein